MSSLGALLPAWRYHLESSFTEVGDYFLSLGLGFLLSCVAVRLRLARRGPKLMLVSGNALACGAFLLLALSTPPAPSAWRLICVFGIGASAGLLNAGMFQAVSPAYGHDAAVTTNRAGAFFGLGCLVTPLLVSGVYYVYTVPSILVLLALLPGFAAGFFARSPLPPARVFPPSILSAITRAAKDPGMLLFGLMLFVQFGNEWSIAGWLPLFLTRRLGISPEMSLMLLVLYWAILLAGRLATPWVIRRMNPRSLATIAISSALLGLIVLASTNNRFGAIMGIVFVSAGFAPIYPLAVRKIWQRSPDYDLPLYSGLFSLAAVGAFLAPWLLGYVAESWGIQAVMIVPMIGACVVFLLMLLIWLEAKLSGTPAVT